ncbi:MAG: acireductone dioxygenase [Lysobacterales bacterium]
MSRLRIYAEQDGRAVILESSDQATITRELDRRGVRFERWLPRARVSPGASPDSVLAAFRPDIDRLMRAHGYQSVDVVSMHPEHPDKQTLRQKFLEEHTHAEDEVRFFVAGSGLFSLHIDHQVCEVRCESGDLINVPQHTRHWFDMGPNPSFVAIRLFTNPDGWVARFTGDPIAQRFPRLDR